MKKLYTLLLVALFVMAVPFTSAAKEETKDKGFTIEKVDAEIIESGNSATLRVNVEASNYIKSAVYKVYKDRGLFATIQAEDELKLRITSGQYYVVVEAYDKDGQGAEAKTELIKFENKAAEITGGYGYGRFYSQNSFGYIVSVLKVKGDVDYYEYSYYADGKLFFSRKDNSSVVGTRFYTDKLVSDKITIKVTAYSKGGASTYYLEDVPVKGY